MLLDVRPPSLLPVESLYARDYSLRAYTSVMEGRQPIGNISNLAVDWTRSKTFFVGGDWRGSFTLKGPLDVLEQWFYERLGAHIEEHAYGQRTWTGLIWEMDLVAPDTTVRTVRRWKRRRRSYETLVNRIRCDYTNPKTGNSGATSWYSDSQSIARYGQKDEIIQRNLNATNAAEAAQEYLELMASGPPVLVGLEQPADEPFLEVTVAGYIVTANFRFVTTDDGSTSTVSAWVEDTIDTDCEFLSVMKLTTNSRSIVQKLSSPTRALALLEDLVTLRDGSGNRFNLKTVSQSRKVIYDIWPNTPVGKLSGGGLYSLSGIDLEQTPRIIEPGIYRDTDYIATVRTRNIVAANGFFASGADFLLETIEVDSEGGVQPRLGVYEDEEAYRTFTFKKEKK